MKVYVQTDIEGVAGFCFFENRRSRDYEVINHRYRMYKLLTAEVNAAVKAAFDAGASEVVVTSDKSEIPENSVCVVVNKAEIFMPQGDLVDKDKELERLTAEKARLEGEISRAEGKLNNPGFVAKAPAALVEKEREKLEVNRGMLESLKARIATLKEL